MATLTATKRGNVFIPARYTATASDTFTYVANSGQSLHIHNNTASAITNVTIKGSAPSAAYPVTGAITMNLTAGYVIASIAANTTYHVDLDSIAPYLEGTGVVTVTNATGATVNLVTN